jgi:hypothetical protein
MIICHFELTAMISHQHGIDSFGSRVLKGKSKANMMHKLPQRSRIMNFQCLSMIRNVEPLFRTVRLHGAARIPLSLPSNDLKEPIKQVFPSAKLDPLTGSNPHVIFLNQKVPRPVLYSHV